MNEQTTYPEWQHKPARLTKEEINDPLPVITQFLTERSLPEHRAIIWNILDAALSSSNSDYIDASEASAWVKWCRDLEPFIEAASVLCGNLTHAEVD